MLIRKATRDDVPQITGIYNYYVLNTHITFDLEAVSLNNRLTWMEQFNNEKHLLFVGTEADKVIGYACSTRFRTKPAYDLSVESTIYLDPAHTGTGAGAALYNHLLDALHKAEVHRCYGVIALPNDASVALHRKLGFKETGLLTEVGYKFDQYWDTLWMEREFRGSSG